MGNNQSTPDANNNAMHPNSNSNSNTNPNSNQNQQQQQHQNPNHHNNQRNKGKQPDVNTSNDDIIDLSNSNNNDQSKKPPKVILSPRSKLEKDKFYCARFTGMCKTKDCGGSCIPTICANNQNGNIGCGFFTCERCNGFQCWWSPVLPKEEQEDLVKQCLHEDFEIPTPDNWPCPVFGDPLPPKTGRAAMAHQPIKLKPANNSSSSSKQVGPPPQTAFNNNTNVDNNTIIKMVRKMAQLEKDLASAQANKQPTTNNTPAPTEEPPKTTKTNDVPTPAEEAPKSAKKHLFPTPKESKKAPTPKKKWADDEDKTTEKEASDSEAHPKRGRKNK